MKKYILFLLVILNLKPSLSSAETSNVCRDKITIDEFRAMVLNGTPIVAEIDHVYAQELAKAFDIKVFSNPEFQIEQTYTGMKLNGDQDPQSQVSLGQPLRLSNFGARSKVSDLLVKSGDSQKQLQLLEIMQKMQLKFYSLSSLTKNKEVLNQAISLASKKVETLKIGVQKGLFSQGDEKIFEGEKFRLEAIKEGLQANISMLQNEISKDLGLNCMIDVNTTYHLSKIPDLDQLLEKSKNNHISEFSRIEVLSNLVEAQKDLAKLDIIPQINPRFVYQHTNDQGDFFGAGITIPIPMFNRNQSEIIRTDAQSQVVKRKQKYISDGGFELELRNLRSAAVSLGTQAEIYESKVIPAYASALENQERMYQMGKANVIQVWQSLRTLYEAKLQYVDYLLQAFQSRSKLSIVVGEEI